MKTKSLDNRIQSNDILTMQLQSTLADLSVNIEQQKSASIEQQNDNIQVSKQLEYRIKTQQQQITKQQEVFEQLQNQQPEDKLYSRAVKLAELGADIEEIMRECDIPRAEADMLMSMRQKRIK
jgi:ferritin-like metal-binding protein YciE